MKALEKILHPKTQSLSSPRVSNHSTLWSSVQIHSSNFALYYQCMTLNTSFTDKQKQSTYRVATCLKDNNTVGKSLIVGFNAESSLFPVHCVFLDEENILYPCNLRRMKNQRRGGRDRLRERERKSDFRSLYLSEPANKIQDSLSPRFHLPSLAAWEHPHSVCSSVQRYVQLHHHSWIHAGFHSPGRLGSLGMQESASHMPESKNKASFSFWLDQL